jgi:hypothetical protein
VNHVARYFSICIFSFSFIASTVEVFATELPFFSRMDIVDTWGSVLYCQSIYQEPDIRGRVYPGDLQACDDSHRLMVDMVKRDYSSQERQEIARDAMKKASAIRHNTRSAQDAVGACRQQCRKLSAMHDEQEETVGNIDIRR